MTLTWYEKVIKKLKSYIAKKYLYIKKILNYSSFYFLF